MVRAIVGGNWGDEGKGKMTDLLAGEADIVVRYQGGANAGHTIVNPYGKFALHLLPSGVFRPGVVNVIGTGVALDPETLFRELDGLAARGVPSPDLRVSDRAQLVLPWHRNQDELEESHLGMAAFGSTKTGIAPFYADKALKIGLQVSDLFEDTWLMDRLTTICESKNRLLAGVYGTAPVSAGDLFAWVDEFRGKLRPMVTDTSAFLRAAEASGKRILLEGQLGALKDPDHGIHPYTTSSSPLAGFAAVGAGLPSQSIREVVAVVKAYSSCVGAGPFLTELFGEEAQTLRQRGGDGGEYGATTGRPRRVGWFDAVATRYGCAIQGATGISFGLLDVLGYLEKIPVCTAYEVDGVRLSEFPTSRILANAHPVYEWLPGWRCDLRGIRRFSDLPAEAAAYVRFAEAHMGVPIQYVSTGPSRDDIIRL